MAGRCKRCLGVIAPGQDASDDGVRVCAACAARGDLSAKVVVPPPATGVVLARPRSRWPGLVAVIVGAVVVAIITAQADHREPSAAPAVPVPTAAAADPTTPAPSHVTDGDDYAGSVGAETEVVADDEPQAPYPDETKLAAMFPVPEVNGTRLDDLYPTLDRWIHPVTDSEQLVPLAPSRKFGAARPSLPTIRPDCGLGHCGVDLAGPRGQPLVAVAAGRVIRVERSWWGRDGRSGRYVRIEHLDGTITAYMHMDDIAPGIDVGVEVEAGQYIGTLGATAVAQSAPHCHFHLELPRSGRGHGVDTTDTYYIDPSPFLVRAQVISTPSYDPPKPPPSW